MQLSFKYHLDIVNNSMDKQEDIVKIYHENPFNLFWWPYAKTKGRTFKYDHASINYYG